MVYSGSGVLPSILSAPTVKRRTWLISSWFDLLFVCGLAPWLLGLVALCTVDAVPGPKALTAEQGYFGIFFVVASLLIGESHQFTSIVRYFTVPMERKVHWVNRLPIWLIIGLPLLAIFPGFLMTFAESIPSPIINALVAAIEAVFLFFPVVLIQHVCAQAKAIGLIYCAKEGYKLSEPDGYYLSFAMWTLVAAGGAAVAAPFGTFFELPPPVAAVLLGLAFCGVGMCAYRIIRRGVEKNEWLPAATGLMWSNMAALILLPISLTMYAWLFVPLFFHATQHWSVAWITRKREVVAAGGTIASKADVIREIALMVLPVLAITMAVLFLPLLLTAISDPSLGLSSTLGVEWSILVFYLHYFSDRIVWRQK
jgi:hypothetical protein